MTKRPEMARTLWLQEPDHGCRLATLTSPRRLARAVHTFEKTSGSKSVPYSKTAPSLYSFARLGQAPAMTWLHMIYLRRLDGLTEAQVHAFAALAWGAGT
jgi:hypothetical protein